MRFVPALILLSLAVGVVANCGGSSDTGAAPPAPTPTDLVVTWSFAGKPASAEECSNRKATQVYLNLSGTVDVTLHQTKTLDCPVGTVTFPGLTVQSLGMPDLEGILLDKDGKSITSLDVTVVPVGGQTKTALDFFGAMGGAGGMSASSTADVAASSTAGSGGAGGMGAGGMGGGASSTVSSSHSSAASTASSTQAASSAASTSGAGGAGGH